MEDKKKLALAEIANKLANVDILLKECEALAERAGTVFYWTTPREQGLWYQPKTEDLRKRALAKLTKEEMQLLGVMENDEYYDNRTGWISSSDDC